MEGIINKNDYVRTHNGRIYKVTNAYILKITCGHTVLRYNDIKSHSSNIIDLIEVGDYVNGYKVEKIEVNKVICIDYCFDCKRYTLATNNPENIKSIVTHEQFENMKYKVE